ncbi:prolyl-tRNA synthetase associated domain-containing protein [Candidatus Dependentiae bacterium]
MILAKSEKDLFKFFDKHNIKYKNHKHNRIFTTKDRIEIDTPIPGAHTKNLFLRNKSGDFWLISMLHERLDIKKFQQIVDSGKLSFASPQMLMEKLGIEPGSVTPFALLNQTSQGIAVILDEKMMEHETLNFHPMRNDMTTSVSKDDFIKFVKLCGHTPAIIDLPKI